MKNMSLMAKLVIFFLIVGTIPLALIGGVSLVKSSGALEQLAYSQLEGMRGVKTAQIENFFAERQRDMNVLTEIVETLRTEAINKLVAAREIKKSRR